MTKAMSSILDDKPPYWPYKSQEEHDEAKRKEQEWKDNPKDLGKCHGCGEMVTTHHFEMRE